MKILRVVGDLYPSVVGGIGLHAHEMSKCQAKMGHDVTVYTSNPDGRPKKESKDGYKILRFKTILKIGGNSFMPMLFFKLIHTRNDFDIIHAHSHLFLSTNFCSLVKKFSSTPLLITNHGLHSQTVPSWLNKIYIPTIGKWTFNSADKILCYTNEEKEMLEKIGIPPAKIAVIHNGIDVDLFVPAENKEKEKQILWIGRFARGKGVEYLIGAFKILIRKNSEIKLLMIGKGPRRAQVEKKIRELGLNGYITIKDFVPNPDLPKVYQNSDILVLSSLEEAGSPRTILEAMACEIPIVCTNLSPFYSIFNEAGKLVPVKDSQALADAISEIIGDRELSEKFGKNGRKIVVKNFSWKDTVKKTIEVYEELI